MESFEDHQKLEAYKYDCSIRIERYKHDLEVARTQGRGTLEYGLQAIKSLILANGAAVISLLTFIGNSKDAKFDSAALAEALSRFGLGTGFAVLVAVTSYVSQSLLAELPSRPDGRDSFEGTAFRYVAALFGIISAALFMWGIFGAVTAFHGTLR